jgi:hypothetical protein
MAPKRNVKCQNGPIIPKRTNNNNNNKKLIAIVADVHLFVLVEFRVNGLL